MDAGVISSPLLDLTSTFDPCFRVGICINFPTNKIKYININSTSSAAVKTENPKNSPKHPPKSDTKSNS